MSAFFLSASFILFVNIGLGLVRVIRGPGPADRMLAAQLFGTTGVALLLLLYAAMQVPAFLDVALVFSLLGAVATVNFVRRRRA